MSKTLELICEDELVTAIGTATQKLGWTQNEFVQKALWNSIQQLDILIKEEKHRLGYINHPVESHEFDIWVDEQEWGDV